MAETSTAIEKRKCTTNWKALEQAGLGIEFMRCDGNTELHPYNLGCHTVVNPTVANIMAHLDGDHGGGFVFKLIPNGKPALLWKALADEGIEARELRCSHCQQEVRFHPVKIAEHFRQHQGWLAKSRPEGQFTITFSREAPLVLDEQF